MPLVRETFTNTHCELDAGAQALLAREPILSETLEVHIYYKGSEEG